MNNTDEVVQPDPMKNRRRWVFGAALLAFIILPVAVREAAISWHQYVKASGQWADARKQAETATRLRQQLIEFKAYEHKVDVMMRSAGKSKWLRTDWEKRRVDVRGRELARREVAGFLAGAGRGPGYFFIPEKFDLHTVQKGDDLFHYRRGDADRLRMTLKGVYLARGK